MSKKSKYTMIALVIFLSFIFILFNFNNEVKDIEIKKESVNSAALEKIIKALPAEPINFQERIRIDISDLRKSGKTEDEIIDISSKTVEIIAEMNNPDSEINKELVKELEYRESLKGRELVLLGQIPDDFIFQNNLPEKPNQKENDSTVIGIDVDNDGVRDDMQILVEYNYQDYPELKKSILNSLSFHQEIRKAGEYGLTDQVTLRKLHDKAEYTTRCEFYYAEKAGLNIDKFSYELGQIIKLQTNNRKRRANDEKVDTSQWPYEPREVNDEICSNLPKIIQ